MKIKFNDYESMQIHIKESYDFDEFNTLVQRLNQIVKIGRKDFVIEQSMEVNDDTDEVERTKRKYVRSGKFRKNTKTKKEKLYWQNDRDKVIKAFKTHYFGNQDDKEKFMKEVGFDKSWTDISKSFFNYRVRHKLKPNEIGLKKFPNLTGLSRDMKREVIEELKL